MVLNAFHLSAEIKLPGAVWVQGQRCGPSDSQAHSHAVTSERTLQAARFKYGLPLESTTTQSPGVYLSLMEGRGNNYWVSRDCPRTETTTINLQSQGTRVSASPSPRSGQFALGTVPCPSHRRVSCSSSLVLHQDSPPRPPRLSDYSWKSHPPFIMRNFGVFTKEKMKAWLNFPKTPPAVPQSPRSSHAMPRSPSRQQRLGRENGAFRIRG